MEDTITRCDVCECVIERNAKISFNNEDFCRDCYNSKFKEVMNRCLKEILLDIDEEIEDDKTKKKVLLLINQKIKSL